MVILSLFNQQIVLCQDDAYILTGYVVNNEVGGEAALQSDVHETFHRC